MALDPAAIPEAGDERISLLVTESACNSGDPATGRVELVELVETESTVEIVIGVRPDGKTTPKPHRHQPRDRTANDSDDLSSAC